MSEPIRRALIGPTEPDETRSCPEHGDYNARHIFGSTWTRCPDCEKAANARRLAEAEEVAREQRKAAIAMILGRSGIPERFAGRTFDTYIADDEKQIRVLRVCRMYAERFDDRLANGGGLVMCGMPGTGKTHLACSIAHQIAEAGRTSLFTSALSAVRRVKQTYQRDSSESESDALGRFFWPDLLIVDEVGVQFGSDTEKMILFEIINGRYERMQPTILISNLTEPELAQFIGDRALDRMREGGGVVLAFDWPSRRREVKHEARAVRDVDWTALSNRLWSDRTRA